MIRRLIAILAVSLLMIATAGAPATAFGDQFQPGPGMPGFQDLRPGQSLPLSVLIRSMPLAATETYSLAIDQEGRVWGWGQVPGRTTTAPAMIENLTNVRSVAAGKDRAYALTADGALWFWGTTIETTSGRAAATSAPARVPGMTEVVAVSAYGEKLAIVRRDGTVWSNLGSWSALQPKVQQMAAIAGVADVSLGAHDLILFLHTDGTVTRWGSLLTAYGSHGLWALDFKQIADQQASQVAAGDGHALALLANGTVLAWGRNHTGQLGMGHTETISGPTPVPGLTDVIAIAAGGHFSAAVRRDGTVWTWGANNRGQLGTGSYTAERAPVQVHGITGARAVAASPQHALVTTETLSATGLLLGSTSRLVSAWGANQSGELTGYGGSSTRPVPVFSHSPWAAGGHGATLVTPTLRLVPSVASPSVGETFTVAVQLEAGHGIRAVDLQLTLSGSLELLDTDPAAEGIQVTPGPAFASLVAQNRQLTNGVVRFTAAAAAPVGTQDTTIATLTVRRKGSQAGAIHLMGPDIATTLVGADRDSVLYRTVGLHVGPASTEIGSLTGRVELEGRTNAAGVRVRAAGHPGLETTTAADGTFTLTGLPTASGIDLIYEFPGYLAAARREFISSLAVIQAQAVQLFAGDLDGDLTISPADMAILALSAGTSRGQAGYSAAADLNNDGKVDGADLALLVNNLHRSTVLPPGAGQTGSGATLTRSLPAQPAEPASQAASPIQVELQSPLTAKVNDSYSIHLSLTNRTGKSQSFTVSADLPDDTGQVLGGRLSRTTNPIPHGSTETLTWVLSSSQPGEKLMRFTVVAADGTHVSQSVTVTVSR